MSTLSDEFSLPPLSEREFRFFQDLIYRISGIHLANNKKTLLVGRLSRRLRELGLRSFYEYYELVKAEATELGEMLDLVTTNETRFFREARHFELLAGELLPIWEEAARSRHRPRRIRIWSAGCATGEEPYTIAMILRSWFPIESGWILQVFGTDLSGRALETARRGVYSVDRISHIPESYRRRFLEGGGVPGSESVEIPPEVRSIVHFRQLNLNDSSYPSIGRFDAIFCRNVLIYFDADSKARVVDRLIDHLVPGGYLFIGHSETLGGMTERIRRVAPTIYTLEARS